VAGHDLSAQPRAAIDCRGLVKRFAGVPAVSELDLTVPQGTLVALLGPSGCGKTTTLRMIAGFERLDAGSVHIGGRVVADESVHVPPERRHVGMVFQEYALFPHMDVATNVAYGLQGSNHRSDRVSEVLGLVGLSDRAHSMPSDLSGGEQQRVALARALAPRPHVVLLDEPFSNLHAGLRDQLRSDVRSILAEAGTTAVLVTHDQEEALGLADEVAVMLNGRVVQQADPETVYHRPVTRDVAAFVGQANFLPGYARGATVECPLGTIDVVNRTSGPVLVMIRPEGLHLAVRSSGRGIILRREFFGHDQLVTLQLDGRLLRARLGPYPHVEPGQPVDVSAVGPVMVYT
jgi:iron(III) transport system ATP-binding protein